MDLFNKTFCISGRFPGRDKHDITKLLEGRGGQWMSSVNSGLDVLVIADPDSSKGKKAQKLSIPIITADELDDVLGEPLGGYRERLERKLEDKGDSIHLHTLAWGEPASEEALAMAQEKIGFELPAAFRNFFAAHDGLSLVWYVPTDRDREAPEVNRELLPWSETAHAFGDLWKSIYQHGQGVGHQGVINIPPLETIFGSDWANMSIQVFTPGGTVKVGRRKVKEEDYYEHLYLTDSFSSFYQAATWADRDKETLWMMMGEDHGATWHDSFPMPWETYMEELAGNLGQGRTVKNRYTKNLGVAYPR